MCVELRLTLSHRKYHRYIVTSGATAILFEIECFDIYAQWYSLHAAHISTLITDRRDVSMH